MFEVQIPVAIADALFPDAGGKERFVAGVKRVRKKPKGFEGRAGHRVVNELPGLAEVFVGADPQPLQAAPRLKFGGRPLRFVELL